MRMVLLEGPIHVSGPPEAMPLGLARAAAAPAAARHDRHAAP